MSKGAKWWARKKVAEASAGKSQEIHRYQTDYRRPLSASSYGTADSVADFDSAATASTLAGVAGENLHLYREAVKTHKGKGKDSKRAQLESVLESALNRHQAGNLFNDDASSGKPSGNRFFDDFLKKYKVNEDVFKHVCVQINATDKVVEQQVLSLSDGHVIENERLVYELYPPGGWKDFGTYTDEGDDSPTETLLEMAIASFHIEKFLESEGHQVEHRVGVAPTKIDDMISESQGKSLIYAHCKSGRGRGPFIPIVTQALQFLHKNQGRDMGEAMADFEAHNAEVKKRTTPYSYRCMGGILGVSAALLEVAAVGYNMLMCEEESMGSNQTATMATANVTGFEACLRTDEALQIEAAALLIPLVAGASMGIHALCKNEKLRKWVGEMKQSLVNSLSSPLLDTRERRESEMTDRSDRSSTSSNV